MKKIALSILTLIFSTCFVFSQNIDITFRVDMQYQSVSPNGVHVAGSFQGWDPSSTPLEDLDGDNIYEVVLSIDPSSTYEYKYVNGSSWGGDESVWGGCAAGNGNRFLDPSTLTNAILPVFVFNSCATTDVPGCMIHLLITIMLAQHLMMDLVFIQ